MECLKRNNRLISKSKTQRKHKRLSKKKNILKKTVGKEIIDKKVEKNEVTEKKKCQTFKL